MKIKNQRGFSLVAVAIFSMLITSLGMGFLYYMRNGHLPMQEMWSRWGKSANVIGKELKNAAGMQNASGESGVSTEGQGLRQAATANEGVRRCILDGKTIYSDTLCLDNNPTTKKLKLNDSSGMEPPKAAIGRDEGDIANQGNAGIAGSTANQELKKKIMEQALGISAAASNASEQDLHMKAIDRAVEKSTR